MKVIHQVLVLILVWISHGSRVPADTCFCTWEHLTSKVESRQAPLPPATLACLAAALETEPQAGLAQSPGFSEPWGSSPPPRGHRT